MTRAEVKKQIDHGWLTTQAAMSLMGLFTTYDEFLKILGDGGIDAVKDSKGGWLFKLEDILLHTHCRNKSAKQLLDEHCPIIRKKKPVKRQLVTVLHTQTEQNEFNRRWFRLHKHVSKLIASKEAHIQFGELRLLHQLLQMSRRLNTFVLILTSDQLEKATRLDDSSLPDMRRSLEARNIIKLGPKVSGGWVLIFLDPRTKEPFGSLGDPSIPMTPDSSWAGLTD